MESRAHWIGSLYVTAVRYERGSLSDNHAGAIGPLDGAMPIIMEVEEVGATRTLTISRCKPVHSKRWKRRNLVKKKGVTAKER